VKPRAGAAALALVALPVVAACAGGSPGEKLWRKHCADCHGLDGAGNTPLFMANPWADLTDDRWRAFGGDRSGLEATIREGVFGEMPAFDQLTTAEMRALLDHLAVLRGETP
jgi:mono/diheme cytochrome c family protein